MITDHIFQVKNYSFSDNAFAMPVAFHNRAQIPHANMAKFTLERACSNLNYGTTNKMEELVNRKEIQTVY